MNRREDRDGMQRNRRHGKNSSRCGSREDALGSVPVRHFAVKEPGELLSFLLGVLSGQSGNAIKSQLHHRCVYVNGKCVTQFNHALIPGDDVGMMKGSSARYGLVHPMLQCLYEDDHILVVNKASGLHTVDTTHGGVENVCAILDNYVRRRDPSKRVYVVHRLDRDTSGVLLFAKTREAQNRLIANWNDRVLERIYIAVAEGRLTPEKGTIDSYLYEDENMVVHSTEDPNRGLRAITHYEVLCANDEYSLVRLSLDTGRTNQIRVHLQSLGHPVTGDGKYGAERDPLHRLGLHALNLCFHHPITQKIMRFSVPEPSEFRSIIV